MTVSDTRTFDTHLILPSGDLAEILDWLDSEDDEGDVLVALNPVDVPLPGAGTPHDYLTAEWAAIGFATVDLTDCEPAPDTVHGCHDCVVMFDAENGGRVCDDHGPLCPSCAALRKCRGCYVD